MTTSTAVPFWDSSLLVPALISAIVSILVLLVGAAIKRMEIFKSAEISYKFQQKQKIKSAIGIHIGKILVESERLGNRLTNLSGNHDKGWLKVSEPVSLSGHYITSTVLRYLCFFEEVSSVQREAISLDVRHADSKDYEFLNYIAAFQWVMSDIEILFHGIPHDRNQETDHFFTDSMRDLCLRFSKIGSRGFEEHETKEFFDDARNRKLFLFFEEMSPTTGPLRWDRVVALNILLAGFQDSFGHRRHEKSIDDIVSYAARATNIHVIRNLRNGIFAFDLHTSQSGRKLTEAIDRIYRAKTGSFLGM